MLYYKFYAPILYYLYYSILSLAFQFYGIKFFIKFVSKNYRFPKILQKAIQPIVNKIAIMRVESLDDDFHCY